VESRSSSPWGNFFSQVGTASWLANFVGTMIGVAIGGLVAIFVLREQLKSDRALFKTTLEEQRNDERRLRRREVAVELAKRLKPAADRLQNFSGLDPWADEWPDYDSSCDAVRSLETQLWINGLYEVVNETRVVLSICREVWGSAHRALEQVVAEHPDEYDPQDLRILRSMVTAELMTGRRMLQSLVTVLLAWEGDDQLSFPERPTVDDLNVIQYQVRQVMTDPLGPTDQESRLDRLLENGKITSEQYAAGMKQADAEWKRLSKPKHTRPTEQ
jgi:hypothetical protein